ncbi:hypothetical protein GCM10009798_26250 [Nocardioides panacihumi]|uniref:Uncharacterized protein n=1 Tax=Nocardioides panacihumi TaxID=400774 RepID=A0ABP5CLG7_9ACTN
MTQTRGFVAPTVIVVALVGIGLVVATMLTPVGKNPLATQPANAQLTICGALIMGTGCTSQASQIRWAGMPKEQTSPPALPGDDPKGTVYVCWTKYEIKDADTKADCYAAVAESYWTVKQGRLDAKAVASQRISSSVAAISSTYAATHAFTSSQACTVNFNVPVNVGIISANVPVKVCKGYKVTRPAYGTTGATWTSTNAATLRVLRTMYAEEVPAGKVPKFTYNFTIPQYTKKWDEGLGRWEWVSHLVFQNFASR